MPVPSQGHCSFPSFPVVDWFCLFIDLWVLLFPLEDCSVFGNFVITLIINWSINGSFFAPNCCLIGCGSSFFKNSSIKTFNVSVFDWEWVIVEWLLLYVKMSTFISYILNKLHSMRWWCTRPTTELDFYSRSSLEQ